jgi:sulfatase maturation enzyme AslB (radical SAM superfamily)
MCTHARSKRLKREAMAFSLMSKTLDDCCDFTPKPQVHFSGLGEPLVYPQIADCMIACKKRRLRWSITTNGYLLSEYSEELVRNDCKAVNVSVHGGQVENDSITGTRGSFERVVEGLRKLQESKKRMRKSSPVVAINCVFNNDNVQRPRQILDTFASLPANSVTFQHLVFSEEEMTKNKSFLITNRDKLDSLAEFVDSIENDRSPMKVMVFPRIRKGNIVGYYTDRDYKFGTSCLVPWLSVRIYPNGDAGMCQQVFGNLLTDSLKSAVNNKKARRFRDLLSRGKFKIPACFRCCHRQYYSG